MIETIRNNGLYLDRLNKFMSALRSSNPETAYPRLPLLKAALRRCPDKMLVVPMYEGLFPRGTQRDLIKVFSQTVGALANCGQHDSFEMNGVFEVQDFNRGCILGVVERSKEIQKPVLPDFQIFGLINAHSNSFRVGCYQFLDTKSERVRTDWTGEIASID